MKYDAVKEVIEGITVAVLASLRFTGLRLPVCQDTTTEMFRTVLLSGVSNLCKTWSVTLRGEHRLSVIWNRC